MIVVRSAPSSSSSFSPRATTRRGNGPAYVYPDAHDQSNWVRTDRFKTRRLCNRAAQESIARLPEPKKAAYKCMILEPV